MRQAPGKFLCSIAIGLLLLALPRSYGQAARAGVESAQGAGGNWAEEPDSFRGVPFLSSEADTRAKFPLEECATSKEGDRHCLFHFALQTGVLGVAIFQKDRLVGVSGLFPAKDAQSVGQIFLQKFGPPSSQPPGSAVWMGRQVSIQLYRSVPKEFKYLSGDVAVWSYDMAMDRAEKLWKMEAEGALSVFKLNFDKGAYLRAKKKADATYKESEVKAKQNADARMSDEFGGFFIMRNEYVSERARRASQSRCSRSSENVDF